MNYYAQSPWRALCGLLIIALVVTAPAVAEPPLALTQHGGTIVSWEPQIVYDHVVLRVSGPAGDFTRTFGEGEVPYFDLATLEGPVDGSYGFELTFAPRLDPEVRQAMQAIRRDGGDSAAFERHLREAGQLPAQPLIQSGNLRVLGGQFLAPTSEEPAATLQPRTPGDAGLSSASGESLRNVSAADQVIADDLIVTGSICVGFDCVNGENFGFDTIRLKENNLRIKFQDTSTGTFPSNDWELTANDSSSGGANRFSIADIDGGKVPFTIVAGAPSNSLYVDSAGDVGLNTSNPVVELHIVDGDSPTVRLEQNGSSGFTPQTWDLAGNETNFFIRDVTNGSQLPFRIIPGADTSSLVITADNDILVAGGNNVTSADASLHVKRTNGTAQILVEEASTTAAFRTLFQLKNNGNTAFEFANTSGAGSWRMELNGGGGANFALQETQDGGTPELVLTGDGNLTIAGSLTVGAGGCTGCDLVFQQPDLFVETIEEHAEYMWANNHLPGVGPTPEDAPMNLSKKTGGILNELEKAHIYIEQLHNTIETLKANADDKDQLIGNLEERLARLEAVIPAKN